MKSTRRAVAVGAASGSIAATLLTLVIAAPSCNEPADFVPYACQAAVPDDAAGAGFLPTLTAARHIVPSPTCTSDGSAPPSDLVVLTQCDDGFEAFFRATDGGAMLVDYYNATENAFVARVSFTTASADGVCLLGPGAFTPPGCSGTQDVCCGAADASYDASYSYADAGPDADGGVLCGTF